jgi:hypothetical protein
MKLDGHMSVFEGKHHMSFEGYNLIANKLLSLGQFNLMLFAWPFLILQWNMIARSASVSSIMLEHISWEGDSMIITIPKHKGDQEGAKSYPKHIYANPIIPSICPILATAVLTFCKSLRHDPDSNNHVNTVKSYKLFEGTNQESRYSAILVKVLSELDINEENRLGAKRNQIGTHSARKGAASYCCGMVGGPSSIQVYLRAGWSLGNVQDRYLFSDNGGDQITGRVVSGLPYTDIQFGLLPPHFDHSVFNNIMLDWELILPGYKYYPNTFKQVIPYLLASIVHHDEWLRSRLVKEHPLFSSYLYSSGLINGLKKYILVRSNYCSITKMTATGIPPHLTIAAELNTMMNRIDENKSELLQQYEQLPSLLTNTLMNKFEINGAIPVTREDIHRMMETISQQIQSIGTIGSNITNTNNNTESNSNNSTYNTWSWGGRLHMVPEGFKLPNNNIRDIFNLWHFGNIDAKIQPYRFLKWHDLINNPQGILLSKMNKVMNELESIIRSNQLVDEECKIGEIKERELVNGIFDQAYSILMGGIRPESLTSMNSSRFGDLSIPRLYDLIMRVKKRKRREEEQEEKQNVMRLV